MEWITGVKLTTLPPDEIMDLVGVGQEAFLVQLLEVGFFHGDPHPGNLLKVRSGCQETMLCRRHSPLLDAVSCDVLP
jgi:predicted unusual protein kinase regulating ubiquinone biosynthesis (AarF/ABC1/UbiB family)